MGLLLIFLQLAPQLAPQLASYMHLVSAHVPRMAHMPPAAHMPRMPPAAPRMPHVPPQLLARIRRRR